MVKTVSVADVCGRFEELADEVRERGDGYIVEKDGQPLVAVVPVEQLRSWESGREELFAVIHEIHERNKDAGPGEIERDIEDALREVRKRHR